MAMAMDIAKVTRENSWHGGRFKHECITLHSWLVWLPAHLQGRAGAGSSLDWYETSRPTCEILLGLS